MASLPTTKTPIRATRNTVNTRVLEAQFGDGYTTRAGDGINTIVETWNVEWAALDSTSSAEIISFLEARGGYESFTWTPPGSSTQKKFICKQWSETHPGNSLKNISATFNQVFDLS